MVKRAVLSSHAKNLAIEPSCPFPVGVEYYRPPTPPTELWDEDFRRIRAAGLRIVRSFVPWNWVEPQPEKYICDDIDLLFELAAKHDLKIWFDTPVGTHLACPEWLIRQYPDMRLVHQNGMVAQQPMARAYAPHGAMIHNFDHPMWRKHVERYIRFLVPRYKDHPSLLTWGTWDAISLATAFTAEGQWGMPPYNDYTIEKYRVWLRERYTLDELNARLLRRYQSWEDVDAPRSNDTIVEMLLYRQFHYENLADHLGWLADLIDRLDGKHEQRSHGLPYPRPWDEIASSRIDSWGLSMPSADHLTSEDAYSVATKCFGFQWSRAIGRNGRWWMEEIYSNFVGGLLPEGKRVLPEELSLFLWLSLIEGAAGALYWQYRPEYMTFEAPGLSLMTLKGEPTARFNAIENAIRQIDKISAHLPLSFPPADLAIAFSGPSMDVFNLGGSVQWFKEALKGVYEALWPYSIPQEISTPSMDWAKYKVVCLPNFALLDEIAVKRLRQVLQMQEGPGLIIEGHFGSFGSKGHWSLSPPDGVDDLVDIEVADFDYINERDIELGKNLLATKYGDCRITRPCQYAILKPKNGAVAIARLGADVVAVQSMNGKVVWFGVPLAATSDKGANAEVIRNLVKSMGITCPFSLKGDHVVAFRRMSRLGGSLVFVINLERKRARATITPLWRFNSVTDLLRDGRQVLRNGGFQVGLAFGEVGVFHCDV